jgi:hypothetical protein
VGSPTHWYDQGLFKTPRGRTVFCHEHKGTYPWAFKTPRGKYHLLRTKHIRERSYIIHPEQQSIFGKFHFFFFFYEKLEIKFESCKSSWTLLTLKRRLRKRGYLTRPLTCGTIVQSRVLYHSGSGREGPIFSLRRLERGGDTMAYKVPRWTQVKEILTMWDTLTVICCSFFHST